MNDSTSLAKPASNAAVKAGVLRRIADALETGSAPFISSVTLWPEKPQVFCGEIEKTEFEFWAGVFGLSGADVEVEPDTRRPEAIEYSRVRNDEVEVSTLRYLKKPVE